jgi:hypothetical protein
MKGLLLVFGNALMGFDLSAQVFDTVDDAKSYFLARYGIDYDTYINIFQKLSDDSDLTDQEVEIVENAEDMFWDSHPYKTEIDTSGPPFRQAGIFEVDNEGVMVIGQGEFM